MNLRNTTRSVTLKEMIKEQIKQRKLVPGQQLATVRQLSKQYRLSVPTVTKVVKTLVAEGVLETRHGCGIFVSKSVRCGINRAIGVIGYASEYFSFLSGRKESEIKPDIQQYIFAECVRKKLICSLVPPKEDLFYPDSETVLSSPIDGALIHGEPPAELLLQLTTANFPFLLTSRRGEKYGVPWIDFDHEKCVSDAFNHLYSLGHRKIGLLLQDFADKGISDKITECFESLACGRRVKSIIKCFPFSILEEVALDSEFTFRNQINKFLTNKPRVTAIISLDVELTKCLIKEIKKLNLKIPADISLMIGGVPEERLESRTTTIPLPFAKFASLAIHSLSNMIDNPSANIEPLLVATEMSIGESTTQCDT